MLREAPIDTSPTNRDAASDHPDTWKFGFPIFHAESRAQLRSWFEVHSETTRGMWLCSWRHASVGPRCPYPEVVEEAICFGWIDSTVSVLDDDRSLQLLTPRKPKSSWTRLNRQRFADMETAGLMRPGGRRAAEIAQANGWWTMYDAVEDLIEPPELALRLDASAEARAAWDDFPASARKQMLWWVISAALDDTKSKRIDTIVERAKIGERAQG